MRHHVSVLFLSSLIAQTISVAVAPVLTRLYTPADFGTLGVYAGLLTVLVSLAALQYEMAIPIARSDQEATDLLELCGVILGLMTFAVGITLALAPEWLFKAAGLSDLEPHRLLIPLGFACLGAYATAVSFATRNEEFIKIARTRLTQAVTGPTAQILLGFAGTGAVGLIIGLVLAQSVGTVSLLRHAPRCRPSHNLTALRSVAWRYRKFPLYTTWGALVGAAGGTLVLYILINVYYTPSIAGFLFLTDRIVGRPLTLVAGSLAPVLFSDSAKAVRLDTLRLRLRRHFLLVSSRYAALAAAWIVIANIAAVWLFPVVFGAAWAQASPYVLAISPWFFCGTVTRSVGPTLLVLQRQALNAIAQIAGPALGTIAFLICSNHGCPASQAVLAFSLCQAAAFAAVYCTTYVAILHVQPTATTAKTV
jgi:O-antigen/teichoic acid export membrane protein